MVHIPELYSNFISTVVLCKQRSVQYIKNKTSNNEEPTVASGKKVTDPITCNSGKLGEVHREITQTGKSRQWRVVNIG